VRKRSKQLIEDHIKIDVVKQYEKFCYLVLLNWGSRFTYKRTA